jgi:predicted branched-subunit amino acid permease
VFSALTVSLWRGKGDIVPWSVAVVLALICEKFLPGKWYIVVGGIGGALASALIDYKRRLN